MNAAIPTRCSMSFPSDDDDISLQYTTAGDPITGNQQTCLHSYIFIFSVGKGSPGIPTIKEQAGKAFLLDVYHVINTQSTPS